MVTMISSPSPPSSPLDYNIPYLETPLVPSLYLSDQIGAQVVLKLELIQPSGSFKSRGLGNLVYRTVSSAEPGTKFHFFSPSGGNAGCATAYAARQYGQKCTVCVPSTTSLAMIARIKKTGATVIPYGNYIADADKYLREALMPNSQERAIYCHPYDNELVWEGNSSLATELFEQFNGNKPDAVVCSVGGGGLYNGLVQGFTKVGWNDIPIVAVETEGCASLNMSLQTGTQVYLESPNTIATSLSTATVTKQTIEYARHVQPTHSVVISDREAAEACINFANDHKLIIEAACGTALSPLYTGKINQILPDLRADSVVVVVVCGGTAVNWNVLEGYSKKFGIPLQS